MKLKIDEWNKLCSNVFINAGLSNEDANIIADAAITADMRGVSSHGTVRLSTYRKRLDMDLINKNPNIKIDVDTPSFIHIDGDNGMGHIVAMFGVNEGVKRAKENGCCCVSIRNTNHMGMLSYYAIKAAEKGVIAYITTNTPPFVAATGGAEPAVGTNPLCWAIPGTKFPVVLDMAISPARGKIKNAMSKGESIPEGWAISKYGKPTTDAKEAMEGVLLPIAGPKGYGLGVITEILSGILSGGKYASYMTHPLDDYEHTPDIGNFMIFIDFKKIIDENQFENRLEDYIKILKSGKKSEGVKEIFIPGEIENNKVESLNDEIDVDSNVYNEIYMLAESK